MIISRGTIATDATQQSIGVVLSRAEAESMRIPVLARQVQIWLDFPERRHNQRATSDDGMRLKQLDFGQAFKVFARRSSSLAQKRGFVCNDMQ